MLGRILRFSTLLAAAFLILCRVFRIKLRSMPRRIVLSRQAKKQLVTNVLTCARQAVDHRTPAPNTPKVKSDRRSALASIELLSPECIQTLKAFSGQARICRDYELLQIMSWKIFLPWRTGSEGIQLVHSNRSNNCLRSWLFYFLIALTTKLCSDVQHTLPQL